MCQCQPWIVNGQHRGTELCAPCVALAIAEANELDEAIDHGRPIIAPILDDRFTVPMPK